MAEGVKQNGVGSFGTDAGRREKPPAKSGCGSCSESRERAAEFGIEHGNECLERKRLAGEETGRLNEAAQFGEGNRPQAVERERAGAAKVC